MASSASKGRKLYMPMMTTPRSGDSSPCLSSSLPAPPSSGQVGCGSGISSRGRSPRRRSSSRRRISLMIHGSSMGISLPMLMACNIAARQSRRAEKLRAISLPRGVWAHGAAPSSNKICQRSRHNCRTQSGRLRNFCRVLSCPCRVLAISYPFDALEPARVAKCPSLDQSACSACGFRANGGIVEPDPYPLSGGRRAADPDQVGVVRVAVSSCRRDPEQERLAQGRKLRQADFLAWPFGFGRGNNLGAAGP